MVKVTKQRNPVNQYLIDYTIRNITTGDEEDTRILELADDEFDGFPDAVRDEVRQLTERFRAIWNTEFVQDIDYHAWEETQMRILELLKPYMSDPELYENDYDAWENNLLATAP